MQYFPKHSRDNMQYFKSATFYIIMFYIGLGYNAEFQNAAYCEF